VNIESDLSPDKILFSETGGFILEVLPKNIDTIKSVFSNYELDVFEIGSTGRESIQINGIMDIFVGETKKAWTNGLREKL
jgi:phosphoribosylformylglycinamidine synthase